MLYLRITVIALLSFALHGCATHPARKHVPSEVLILVSADVPAYSSVANELVSQLGRRASVLYLSGSQAENNRKAAAYRNDESKQFVSIGLRASIAANALTKRQVVFCQVFNYQEYGLISSMHKGVSMIPDMSRIFHAWREIAPDIRDIGLISGPHLDDMIQTARQAAKENGITLHYVTVNFDKEYQYAYKHMAGKVQGYWLLPDNRVLSRTVLRDIMGFSMRNGKQVAVSSDELLNLGGLFTIDNDSQDVAHKVLQRLDAARKQETMPGPDIVYPDKLVIHVNTVMAKRLGLKLSGRFRKHESVF
jgi:ABC-type uncharacterized transport system substrate-binding protein